MTEDESQRLSKVVAGLPRVHVAHETVVTPWEEKGVLMRKFVERVKDRDVLLVDGVKVFLDDSWALVLPDPIKDVFKVLGVASPAPSPPMIPLGTEWPHQQTRAGWVFDHRKPLLTVDLRDSPPFLEHASLLKEGIRWRHPRPIRSVRFPPQAENP